MEIKKTLGKTKQKKMEEVEHGLHLVKQILIEFNDSSEMTIILFQRILHWYKYRSLRFWKKKYRIA